MLHDLPPTVQQELKPLMDVASAVRIVELGMNHFAHPDNTRGRLGEVCMIFRRPGGELLTFRKTFYPPGVYRLLTGGINPGESVVDALRREVGEETGLPADPHRLLLAMGYRVEGAGPDPSFYTFTFLLDEVQGTPAVVDLREQIEDFRWVETDELLRIAEGLERLREERSPDLETRWSDWGRFRAVIHRAVWEILSAQNHSPHPA